MVASVQSVGPVLRPDEGLERQFPQARQYSLQPCLLFEQGVGVSHRVLGALVGLLQIEAGRLGDRHAVETQPRAATVPVLFELCLHDLVGDVLGVGVDQADQLLDGEPVEGGLVVAKAHPLLRQPVHLVGRRYVVLDQPAQRMAGNLEQPTSPALPLTLILNLSHCIPPGR